MVFKKDSQLTARGASKETLQSLKIILLVVGMDFKVAI